MADANRRDLDAILRTDFLSFLRKTVESLLPGTSFLNNWHLELICSRVQPVIDNRRLRLIVNAPPRSLKSNVLSVALPALLLGYNPSAKIICASYSESIANKLAYDFRQTVKSDWYKRIFPKTVIVKDTETETVTASNGFRYTASVGGSITGRGSDLIVIDDPLNASEAASKLSREQVTDWFRTTVLSRLDNPAKGSIIVGMQRLHVDDLSGFLLAQEGWEQINLPAMALEDRIIDLPGGRKFHWRRGEPLHAARLPQAELDNLKTAIGSAAFSAQYLQLPVPPQGGMLKAHWLKHVTVAPYQQSGDQIVQSWDTALKANDGNDYSVCLTFLIRRPNEVCLIDVARARLEFPELNERVIREAKKHAAKAILIEDHGSGTSLIQNVKPRLPGVIGISHHADKPTRMYSATPHLEGGMLHLPQGAPWLDDFLEEYLAFPKGRHDDQMDALSQFLNWHGDKQRTIFEVDWGY